MIKCEESANARDDGCTRVPNATVKMKERQ